MNEAPEEEGEPTELGRPGEDGEPKGNPAQENPGIPEDGRGMDEESGEEQEAPPSPS